MRATGIFTGTTSSPCQLARQSHFRYAIRAGRNLPDKEFRSILLLLRCLRLLALAFSFWLESHKRFWVGHSFSYVIRIRPLTALAAEEKLPSEKEWTFLPLSACRHAVRTISFPTQVRVGIWHVVSEDFGSSYRCRRPHLER